MMWHFTFTYWSGRLIAVVVLCGVMLGTTAVSIAQAGWLPRYEAVRQSSALLWPATLLPNDPHVGDQGYLNIINAFDAWDYTQGRSVVVAVLDSGVDIDHPDLQDRIWVNPNEVSGDGLDNDGNGFIDDVHGWDFVTNTNNPSPKIIDDYDPDAVSHGTIVAGIIAATANNQQGITGIAPLVRLMPIRFIDSNGRGDIGDAIKAIKYAVANGAQVINMSFVGQDYAKAMETALIEAQNQGVVVISAAGNSDGLFDGYNLDEQPHYPICYGGDINRSLVVGVAAVDDVDHKSSFSNYGASCVDIAAPGEGIYSTMFYEGLAVDFQELYGGGWSGTSMAAPQVAAAAAMVRALLPDASATEIVDLLLSTSVNIDQQNSDGSHGAVGVGRLNIFEAVTAAITRELSSPDTTSPWLAVAPAAGSEPRVTVLDRSGKTVASFLAYNQNFRGGVDVAIGDMDADGVLDIVTGAGSGGGPHVRVFDWQGQVKYQFFAYEQGYTGGVRVALGDVDADGLQEIITAPGRARAPQVKVFTADGQLQSSFMAYAELFRGGVRVASGDVNGDGIDEVITGAGSGGGPHVRTFQADGRVIGQFFSHARSYTGGLDVAVATDGRVVVTPLAANGLRVVVAHHDGTGLVSWPLPVTSGVFVSAGTMSSQPVIVVAPVSQAGSVVTILSLIGEVLQRLAVPAYGAGLTIGTP